MSKPSQLPSWATDGGSLIQDPGAAKRAEGWKVEIPPVEFFNWWQNNVGQWVEYFDGEVDKVTQIQGLYDAIVSPTGTHATINDVIADMDGVALPVEDVRIYVLDPISPTVTQLIDKAGVEVTFHPSASFAKGATTVVGLQIDAPRVKIEKGRFLNFDEAGGKAIELTANAKNCFVMFNTFGNNTDEIENNGANNQLIGNMTEVV